MRTDLTMCCRWQASAQAVYITVYDTIIPALTPYVLVQLVNVSLLA